MTANFDELLPPFVQHGVRFILIGGGAALAHGLPRPTYDVDLVYARDAENIRRIVELLKPFHPYLRGAPPGLPFQFDEPTIAAGLNFTLTTDLGDLDLLGEVAGGGTYEKLLPFSGKIDAFGITCRVVSLERLIQLKRAAGRLRDLLVLSELQALLEERRAYERPPDTTL
jgi:predicted nucleotidyltransferase